MVTQVLQLLADVRPLRLMVGEDGPTGPAGEPGPAQVKPLCQCRDACVASGGV